MFRYRFIVQFHQSEWKKVLLKCSELFRDLKTCAEKMMSTLKLWFEFNLLMAQSLSVVSRKAKHITFCLTPWSLE